MKFVFFGSPIFARLVLEELIGTRISPLAVVCNPDRPVGRHQEMKPPEVKSYILEHNLPIKILQPENPSSLSQVLRSLSPDFFVVAAYGKILSPEILEIPRLGTIGVHSSLLPKYRGTSPIHATILNGDTETGATIYMMDDKMDHGAILAQHTVPISNEDTHETLVPKVWSGGGKLLAHILPDFMKGSVKPRIQNEAEATYTKKFTSADGYIDPKELEAAMNGDSMKAIIIDRKMRAFGVEPGVWSRDFSLPHSPLHIPSGKRVKLLEAKIENGTLVLKKIQIEGEKPRVVS